MTERRGEHRTVKEVDDILSLVTFVDENKAIIGLPRYATDDSNRIPTARLESGDVFVFSSKFDRIDDNIGNIKAH